MFYNNLTFRYVEALGRYHNRAGFQISDAKPATTVLSALALDQSFSTFFHSHYSTPYRFLSLYLHVVSNPMPFL
jgi:hypothetical protein